VQVLKQVGGALVEIHGQHDERALVDAATHRRLLDAFGGLEDQTANVGALWEARREARAAADAHRAEVERAKREGDWLRHAVEELNKLSPQAGEETALAERRTAMMQAEKVAEDLREAHEVVAGTSSSVPALSGVIRRLERRAAQAPGLVEPTVKSLDAALTALDEVRGHLETALRTADFDPADLERIEERLFALRAAGRKYNVPVDGLAALARKYNGDIALIDAGEGKLKALEATAEQAEASYRNAAQTLSRARHKAAAALDKAVNGELKPLKLERAKFSTQIDSDPATAGPDGIDRAEFWVQTNPGTRPGPMMRVASGGELARFLLALKVVLADRGSAPTLVFDEIDTGVGGAVADAIGMRLAKLASGAQVLAVTHAPQVAARADRHYLIAKDTLEKGKRVATRVTELASERRREEIARMLAGAEITNEARAAAERLIKAAS
ncbi:MAG: DNA repair protein RecN, partial [Pseudolabrys sp.]